MEKINMEERNGWMDNKRTYDGTDEWTNGWTDRQKKRKDGIDKMDGWIKMKNGWTEKRIDGRTDGWTKLI